MLKSKPAKVSTIVKAKNLLVKTSKPAAIIGAVAAVGAIYLRSRNADAVVLPEDDNS